MTFGILGVESEILVNFSTNFFKSAYIYIGLEIDFKPYLNLRTSFDECFIKGIGVIFVAVVVFMYIYIYIYKFLNEPTDKNKIILQL